MVKSLGGEAMVKVIFYFNGLFTWIRCNFKTVVTRIAGRDKVNIYLGTAEKEWDLIKGNEIC